MAYGELYLPPERPKHNAVNGQFLKGHVPHNKGKKWSEWMSKRGQRKVRKGWKNLEKYRPKERPDTAGRCRKAAIAGASLSWAKASDETEGGETETPGTGGGSMSME